MKKRLVIYLFLVLWTFGFLPVYRELTRPWFSSESGYTSRPSSSSEIVVHLVWLAPVVLYCLWEMLRVREASRKTRLGLFSTRKSRHRSKRAHCSRWQRSVSGRSSVFLTAEPADTEVHI